MGALRKAAASLSAVGGVAGAAVLGGATAQRMAVHRYRELDQVPGGGAYAEFDRLPADRSYSVAADDGVALHVEEVGSLDAPLTVIFSHGWTLRLGAWHFQRIALAGNASRHDQSPESSSYVERVAPEQVPAVRLVFYDQRSHGQSSRAEPGRTTIDQLGRDLAAVIATAAPTGPIVLVGHSMGGMAILALAGGRPDLVTERVAGVALMSTSADEKDTPARRWLQVNGANPLLPMLTTAAGRFPKLFEKGRDLGRDAVWLATRALGFADKAVPAPLVDYVDRMISATPIEVVAEFAPALFSHDERAALPALTRIPTLIAVGAEDRMTPPSRARSMAEQLPDAKLLLIPGAGHLALMEAAEEVNDALLRLLRHAWRQHGTHGTDGTHEAHESQEAQ